MGMFSEIHAGFEAAGYDTILMAAINTGNQEIIGFCKEHVYPKYQYACGETWDKNPTDNYKFLVDTFEKI